MLPLRLLLWLTLKACTRQSRKDDATQETAKTEKKSARTHAQAHTHTQAPSLKDEGEERRKNDTCPDTLTGTPMAREAATTAERQSKRRYTKVKRSASKTAENHN